MTYQLIQDLCESRIFRTRQATQQFDAAQSSELFYAVLLSVAVLASDKRTVSWATAYAERTAAFAGFERFRAAGTDLYVLAHMVLEQRPNPLYAQRLIVVLRGIAKLTVSVPFLNTFLMQTERMLNIKSTPLRSLRRALSQWHTLPDAAKRTHLTMLKRIIISHSRRAEVLPQIDRLLGTAKGTQAAMLGGAALAGLLLGLSFDPGKRVGFLKPIIGEQTHMDTQPTDEVTQALESFPVIDSVEHVEQTPEGLLAVVVSTDGTRWQINLTELPQ